MLISVTTDGLKCLLLMFKAKSSTDGSGDCEETSASAPILIILAVGDSDSGDERSSAPLTSALATDPDPAGRCSVLPLTSTISILLSGF